MPGVGRCVLRPLGPATGLLSLRLPGLFKVTLLGNGTSTCHGRSSTFRMTVNFRPPVTQAGGTGGGSATARSSNPLHVSPNPARSQVTVQLGAEGVYRLQLVDRLGQPAGRSKTATGSSATIDLTALLPGAYMLQVTDQKSGRQRQVQIVR